MKKVIIGLLCLVVLSLGACASPTTPPASTPESPTPTPTPGETLIDLPQGKVTVVTDTGILTTDVVDFPGVAEGFGLYGATVTITNVYPGYSGSAPITIVNGKDYARTFHLMLQQPGTALTDGYQPFPEEYFNWVTVEDIQPKVAIGGVKKISVTLSAPFDFPESMYGQKYDLRVLVEDWSQTGFIQKAYQEKWLITFWDGES